MMLVQLKNVSKTFQINSHFPIFNSWYWLIDYWLLNVKKLFSNISFIFNTITSWTIYDNNVDNLNRVKQTSLSNTAKNISEWVRAVISLYVVVALFRIVQKGFKCEVLGILQTQTIYYMLTTPRICLLYPLHADTLRSSTGGTPVILYKCN